MRTLEDEVQIDVVSEGSGNWAYRSSSIEAVKPQNYCRLLLLLKQQKEKS